METQKKRIRREYAPLTVYTGLVCTTPLSPVTQVFNPSPDRQYEPNRQFTPTVIHPDVVAHAKDGSWKTPQANAYLANMVWKVNGVDITTLNAWQGYFTIDTVGATRGDITITKNLTPGSYVELSFEAVLADNRLGVNIPIKCDPIILSTVDKSEDDYSMSIGDDQIIQYDPFKDKLHLYEYKVAHGLIAASTANRNAAIDENSYERTITADLFKGTEIQDGWWDWDLYNFTVIEENNYSATIRPWPTNHTDESVCNYVLCLFRITGITSGNVQLEMIDMQSGEQFDELVSLVKNHVTLDLRLVQKQDYLLRAYKREDIELYCLKGPLSRPLSVVSGTVLAEKQFSVNRIYPKFTVRPTNGTSINPHDADRYDIAMVDCDGNTVECPESIIKIIWKTDSAALTNVVHGEGGEIVFPLAATGLGDTYLDDWLDVYCDGDQKEIHSIAIDESNNELTDENGETLIFN